MEIKGKCSTSTPTQQHHLNVPTRNLLLTLAHCRVAVANSIACMNQTVIELSHDIKSPHFLLFHNWLEMFRVFLSLDIHNIIFLLLHDPSSKYISEFEIENKERNKNDSKCGENKSFCHFFCWLPLVAADFAAIFPSQIRLGESLKTACWLFIRNIIVVVFTSSFAFFILGCYSVWWGCWSFFGSYWTAWKIHTSDSFRGRKILPSRSRTLVRVNTTRQGCFRGWKIGFFS